MESMGPLPHINQTTINSYP